jgi:hypothetical protein
MHASCGMAIQTGRRRPVPDRHGILSGGKNTKPSFDTSSSFVKIVK